MFKIIFTSFAILFSIHSLAMDIDCEAKKSLQTEWIKKINIQPDKRVMVGQLEQFKVFFKNRGQSHYELEVYDQIAPARHYSEANLKSSTDFLSWTLWTRKELIQIKCKLAESI